MSRFDEEPDAPVHGECAAAIASLTTERDEARKERDEARRERDEARQMLEGSVTDAAFESWRESADLRVLEAEQKQHSAESRLAQAEAANSQMREALMLAQAKVGMMSLIATASPPILKRLRELEAEFAAALSAPPEPSPLLAKLKAAKKMVQALGMVTGHFPANNPKGERAEFICRSCAKEVSEALRLWIEAEGEG